VYRARDSMSSIPENVSKLDFASEPVYGAAP